MLDLHTPTYGTAIKKLRPNTRWILPERDLSRLEWDESNTVPRPSDDEIIAEYDRQMAEWNAKQYQRDRAEVYPDLDDQLDLLYHDIKSGVNLAEGKWVQAVEQIKAAHPKPE